MTARSFGDVAANFVGYRNPDRTNVPRRNSYDVNDPRADVWQKIGDGSQQQGRAWRAAKLETLRQWIHRQWTEGFEGANAARDREHQLRRIDHYVLEAILSFINYKTGELFPCYASIAEKAGVCRATVAESLRRLKYWKIIAWVRRSVVADTAGAMGPQREQTSNAYHFACEREMEPRARAYFAMALKRNLGKLGGAVASIVRKAVQPPPIADPALQAALDRIESHLLADPSNRSEAVEGPPSRSPSASPENRLYPPVGSKE